MRIRKQKQFNKRFACIIAGLVIGNFAQAQVSIREQPANRWLFLAEEQYQQGHYQLTLQSANKYLYQPLLTDNSRSNDAVEKAMYYRAAAEVKLNTPGCIDSATALLSTTANPAYKQRLSYTIAQYYFHHNQLNEAIYYYELAGISNLSNKELIDEKFELAYGYFNNKQFDKAEPLFASIKELQQGKYFSAGNYYYGLLAYNENNYKDALQSFERIKDLPEYRNIVPYYIAEIHYFMGERDKALAYSLELIKRPDKLYYDNELHLLAAQCYFEDQQYSEALPYFEYYYEHIDKIRKEDLYEMAYCYYRVKSWDNAIDKFKQLGSTRDSLGQTSMYLLGDCYINIGDKKSARNAFGICAEMPFNPGQQEASLILFAKLSYEMGYNDDALEEVNYLLANFPNSKYRSEAKTLASELLIKTNNYAGAYTQLQDVPDKDANYRRVYQKVTYAYGMKQLQNGDQDFADSLLAMSLEYPEDPAYEAAAYFWRGELAYRRHQFAQAVSYSQAFINKNVPAASLRYLSPGATLQHAYLTMGYAAMEQNSYNTAQSYFNQAQHSESSDSSARLVAAAREADAMFMQKDYSHAAALYDKIIVAHGPDEDYARFQKSIVLGLQGKKTEKIALLQLLINKVPESKYVNNARYELALVYIDDDKYQAAITLLQPLTNIQDNKSIAPKAWMKIGFAYQQLGSSDKAADAYKHVVTEYPASDERPAAMDALKSIYIENGHPAAYTQLLKDNNLPSADSTVMDSTYYAAAEAQFAESKWDKAVKAFTLYLQQYPNGVFIIKAHYYRAESNYQLKNYKDALSDYSLVLDNPWSPFTENSARRAAAIAYQQKDYAAAMNYYAKLRSTAMGPENLQDAYTGLLQSSFYTNKYDDAISYSDTLLSLPNLDDSKLSNAQLYKARSLQELKKPEDALNIYKQLETAKDGAIAAEARYYVANAYYEADKLKDAEAAATSAIKESSGYDYWIVKSYILLSDILVKEKDYFNAKATLESIVKRSKIPELKEEAAKKLEQVRKLDKQQHSKLSEE